MLILVCLAAVFLFLAFTAWRFFRLEDAVEHRVAAARERKRVVFEGVLGPREAREALPEELLRDYAGERVRVTVERVPPAGGPSAGA